MKPKQARSAKAAKDLRTIEDRIVTELLWHLSEGSDRVYFDALVGDADDETTIADLLNVAEYLRSK